jgi:hypothetical protein
MGRGSNHSSAASATLRAVAGGRETTGRQPAMDPVLDRLWLTRAKELGIAARALAKVSHLGDPQRSALVSRLNALGAEVGLAPVWQLVARGDPIGSERINAAYVVGGHPDGPMPHATHLVVLEDAFDGGTIDGMSEGRYLGRKLCELPDWIDERYSPMVGLLGRY